MCYAITEEGSRKTLQSKWHLMGSWGLNRSLPCREKMFQAGVAACMHEGSEAELGSVWGNGMVQWPRVSGLPSCSLAASPSVRAEVPWASGHWERITHPLPLKKSPFSGVKGEWKAGEEMPQGPVHVTVCPSLPWRTVLDGHSLHFTWSDWGCGSRWGQGKVGLAKPGGWGREGISTKGDYLAYRSCFTVPGRFLT